MPVPDLGARRSSQARLRIAQERTAAQRLVEQIAGRLRRGRKRPDGEAGESVPAKPNRPNNLSGGAAAPLELGD